MPAHTRRRRLARTSLKAILTLTILAGATGLLGGCNTTAGAGKDLSAAGHAVTSAAERTRERL